MNTLSDYRNSMSGHDKKEYRFVSTQGLEMLGQGGYGKIYYLPPDRILKVFYGFSAENEIIESAECSYRAREAGIPCMILHEIVRSENGIALLGEYIPEPSLAEVIHSDNSRLEEGAILLAELARQMGQTHFNAGFRRMKDRFSHALDRFSDILPPEDIAKYNRLIAAVPDRDTAIHGDFHAKNILLRQGKPVLIDMDDFCCGHPIWDLAVLAMYSEEFHLPFGDSVDSLPFAGLSHEEKIRVWKIFLREYFRDVPEQEIQDRCRVILLYSGIRFFRIVWDRCPGQGKDDDIAVYCAGLFHDVLSRISEDQIRDTERIFSRWH